MSTHFNECDRNPFNDSVSENKRPLLTYSSLSLNGLRSHSFDNIKIRADIPCGKAVILKGLWIRTEA
uniref:Uncharacterized protein n=1 Tax=Caenorhabditis japonica TaxID=281687 RepID=A0A8R1IDU0_CAEJA